MRLGNGRTLSQVPRRRFLGGLGFGGGAVLLGGPAVLAGCGDDSGRSGATTSEVANRETTGTSTGATSEPAAAELTTVEFQLSWLDSVQFGGSYLALDRGYYEDEGLDVTLTPGGPNAPVDPPVIAGQAIAGISAADYAGRSVAEGAAFKILGVAMQKNPFVIASLPDNPVREPGDLEGMSIGMAAANQPVLDALATFNGFDAGAVNVVPTQYDPAPLVNGEVDCLLCWLTDLPVAMTTQGIDNETMLLANHGYKVHSQTYIALEETVANDRSTLLSLLRAEIRGWQDYKADPAAAAALTVDMFPDLGLDLDAQELQAEEQLSLMFSDVTDREGFLWFTDESVAENVETLAELGVEVSEDLWDRSLLEEIFADGPTL